MFEKHHQKLHKMTYTLIPIISKTRATPTFLRTTPEVPHTPNQNRHHVSLFFIIYSIYLPCIIIAHKKRPIIIHDNVHRPSQYSALLQPACGKITCFKDIHVNLQFYVLCSNAKNVTGEHFADVSKMVEIGSETIRNIDDIMLSRYA